MSGSDQLLIRGMRVIGYCGMLPEERARPQPLEIDLDVAVDMAAAGRSDALADAVDYGHLSGEVVAVFADQRFELLERAAQVVADVALRDSRVTEVTVELRKLRPPVPMHMASSGVRITRRRD